MASVLEELVEKAYRELGRDASDEEVATNVLGDLEVLTAAEKTEVIEQIIRRASATQLAHLREVAEAVTGREIPGPGQP